MEMQQDRNRNILIGIAAIIVIILIVFFVIRSRQKSEESIETSPLPTPVSSYQQQLQNNFGITVPSTAIKADLVDVGGGNQMGLATFDKSSGQNVYTVLANLDDPQAGYFYEAWLVRGTQGSANYDIVPLGNLSIAKGGWLVNYQAPKDLSDHKTIWITLEKYLDTTSEKHILEGTFQ